MSVATPAAPPARPAPAKARPKAGPDLKTRLDILSRTLAGVFAGYGMSALSAACFAVALPGEKADAALSGTLISFLVYTAAIIWAYACASHWRAWIGILLPAALFGAVFMILR